MSDKNTGGSAFPQPATTDGHATNTYGGMSLRDYFAAKAMQGFISLYVANGDFDSFKVIAKTSVKMADAMIAELNK